MRAALYARVSSAIQRDRHTIESQLRVLPAFASSRGWTVVATFIDDGRTAKAGHLEARTGLEALLAGAARRDFDVVVVIDLDRFTRSEDLIERAHILGSLQRAKVLVADVGRGLVLDPNSDEGDLQIALGGYFAAAWSRKHRTRIVEGKLTAIAKGKKPAGPTPFGYRYDRWTGVWSVCEEEAELVREIYRRVLAGETAAAIADDLHLRGAPSPRGRWDRPTVYRILRQPAYRGEWIADKRRRLTIATPVIVDAATWYAIRDRAAAVGRRGLRRTRHHYLIEALGVCALCGAKILIASASFRGPKSQSAARYICARRRRPERGEEPCAARYWLTSEVDDRVWAAIAKLVNTPGRLERVAKKALAVAGADADMWRRDLEAAERRLQRLVRTEAAILQRYQAGMISDEAFDAHLETSKRERALAQLQLEAAQGARFAAGRATTRATALQDLIAELRATATKPSPAKRRELVERVLRMGAVRLSIATIELDVELADAAGHGAVAGSSSVTEANMRIRLVA